MKTSTILLATVLAGLSVIACSFRASAQENHLTISVGQSVYVVALDTSSRRSDFASTSLELERKAKEQFAKEKKFKIASVLKGADFVFVIAIDRGARDSDEIAIAVSPSDYEANSTSLEKMREAAVWQSAGHYNRGKHAGIAAATVGYSAFFDHPSVVKGLVKQFHKDVH